jgi:hypothetical protein
MSADLPRRVQSTLNGPRVQRLLTWRDDEIHPYAYLEGYKFIVPGGRYCFTQPVGPKGSPIGHQVAHRGLAEALDMLGWEVLR